MNVRCGRCRGHGAGALVVLVALAASLVLAQKPAEVHGSLDAFAGEGVAMAWGVLRGRDEATTEVVVRVEAEPARYAIVSVTGVDPFTRATQVLAGPAPIGGSWEFRAPRARFADLPRTEWRFFAPGVPASASAALLVYFQGIPDTTPEFDDGARMQTDIAQRLSRARNQAKARP